MKNFEQPSKDFEKLFETEVARKLNQEIISEKTRTDSPKQDNTFYISNPPQYYHRQEKLTPTEPVDWTIEKAQFNPYNETTLALVKGPDDQRYLILTAGYPYGTSSEVIRPYHKKHLDDKRPPKWNNLLDSFEGDLEAMANSLKALPVRACQTDDPEDEFEELFERTRFLSKGEIVDLLDADNRDESLQSQFVHTDFCRTKLYDDENFYFKIYGDKYIDSVEGAKTTIEDISRDFGIACPRPIRLARNLKNEGDYLPKTTEMRLKWHEGKGVRRSTLLHEMAHHINNKFVCENEKPNSAHGYTFRKIYMHLLHRYGEVPMEKLTGDGYLAQIMKPYKMTPDDILSRDFTMRGHIDIKIPPKVSATRNFNNYHSNLYYQQPTTHKRFEPCPC